MHLGGEPFNWWCGRCRLGNCLPTSGADKKKRKVLYTVCSSGGKEKEKYIEVGIHVGTIHLSCELPAVTGSLAISQMIHRCTYKTFNVLVQNGGFAECRVYKMPVCMFKTSYVQNVGCTMYMVVQKVKTSNELNVDLTKRRLQDVRCTTFRLFDSCNILAPWNVYSWVPVGTSTIYNTYCTFVQYIDRSLWQFLWLDLLCTQTASWTTTFVM